jgi:hypothetical protein
VTAQARTSAFGAAPRLGWAALLIALWLTGYFGAASLAVGRSHRFAMLEWDAMIPCLPALVPLYLVGVLVPVLPALLVPSGRFFAIWRSYAFVIVSSVLLFALLPVTTLGLRADCPSAPGTLLHLLRSIDPPVNAFPSLHVALACLAALALRGLPVWGRLAAAHAVLQAGVVLLVKQHQIVDVAGGVALAFLAHLLFLRPDAPAAERLPR